LNTLRFQISWHYIFSLPLIFHPKTERH